jgi:hypothetical protein
LIITNITYYEIKDNLIREIEILSEKTSKIFKNTPAILKKHLKRKNFNLLLEVEKKEEIKKELLKELEQFIQENFILLDCYKISPEIIFTKYFNTEAPFRKRKIRKVNFQTHLFLRFFVNKKE